MTDLQNTSTDNSWLETAGARFRRDENGVLRSTEAESRNGGVRALLRSLRERKIAG